MVKAASPKAKKVGSGYYSQAYGRPRSNMVIKISHGEGGDSQRDTLKFLRWAKKQKNPHLPKIYNISKRVIRDEENSIYGDPSNVHVYVRMERLIPFKPNKYKWKPEHVPFLEWMEENGYSYFEPDQAIPNWEALKREAKRLKIKSSKLVRTLQSLTKIVSDYEELDISISYQDAGNIMLRPGTNEIVIHDPIAA